MYSAFYNLNGKVSLVFINEVHKIPRGKGSDNLLWNSINDYSLTVVIKKKKYCCNFDWFWLVNQKKIVGRINKLYTYHKHVLYLKTY